MQRSLDVEFGENETIATLTFYDQDHTIGNSLRYMCMKNKNTSFCGYTIPHPLENKMKLRIQTTEKPALKVVEESIDSLCSVLEVIMDKFNGEVNKI